MGELIDGIWHAHPPTPAARGRRPGTADTGYRGWVRADGQPGPDGRRFPAEAGRYRLVVALSCPWAHRALLARALLGLERAIALDVVEPLLGAEGWAFAVAPQTPTPGSTYEGGYGLAYLRQLYTKADARYCGRVTVPVLWDVAQSTVVNNESADVMRMLATEFSSLAERPDALLAGYPADEVDRCNAELVQAVNLGVYRCGMASAQASYDAAIGTLFAALEKLDQLLGRRRFLLGARPCEADWRLFVTLVRFDWVYVTHFRCNLRRLADFVHLPGYLRELYQWPKVADTVHEAQIKANYFGSPSKLNPYGIVPAGFATDFQTPGGREHLAAGAGG